ncbi:MAG TPA: hypothetical protein VNF99_01670 [Stellaceae bacterium]|nr:hypothetical protein [Stellaceae bacterium]
MDVTSAAMALSGDDAALRPTLAARPPPLCEWPPDTASVPNSTSVNDNRVAEIDWNALAEPLPAIEPPPPPPRNGIRSLETAAYGLAGAAAVLVALGCLAAG